MANSRSIYPRNSKLIRSGQEWHSKAIAHYPGETLRIKAEADQWFYLDVCNEGQHELRSKRKGGRIRGYAFPMAFLNRRSYNRTRNTTSLETVFVVIRNGWGREDTEVELTIWVETSGSPPKSGFLSPPPKEVTATFDFGEFYPEKVRPILRVPSAIKFVQWAIVGGFAGLALLAYYLLEYPVAPKVQQTLATVAEIALVLTTLTLVWATMARMGGSEGGPGAR